MEHIMELEVASQEDGAAQAASEWGISPKDVTVTVLEEEKRLFGLFGRKLKVEVRPNEPVLSLHVRDAAVDMLALADLDVNAVIKESWNINLDGEDAGIVIGRYGDTIKALEYLSNLMMYSESGGRRVRFDCGGYRERREVSLARLAESVARDACRTHRSITLDPMSSWGRRIIHVALENNSDVETRSSGEEPLRRVVVSPKRTRDFKSNRRH